MYYTNPKPVNTMSLIRLPNDRSDCDDQSDGDQAVVSFVPMFVMPVTPHKLQDIMQNKRYM